MAGLWPCLVATIILAAGAPAWAQSPPMGASPAAVAPPAAGGLSASKRADSGLLGGKWYSTAELRYHLNTYYAEDGRSNRQDPSMHARLQVGAQFYDGLVDAYTTLGVFKEPRSQQVLQRRPEVALDFYPFKNEYVTLLQYSLLKLPVRADASGQAPEDEKDDYSASTVYLFGVAPTVKVPLISGPSRFDLKAGLDGWSKLYSRKQYTSTYRPVDDRDPSDEHMALTTSPGGSGDGQPIEDYAMHYQAQVLTGFGFSPAFARAFSAETTVHYHSRFEPAYSRDVATGNVDYTYAVDRYSYFRVRLHYDINDRVAITNDFYDFRAGFFAAERHADEWRYRDIARISCRL